MKSRALNIRQIVRDAVRRAVFTGPTVHCGKLNFERRLPDNSIVVRCRGCGVTFYARGADDELLPNGSVIRREWQDGKRVTVYARGMLWAP